MGVAEVREYLKQWNKAELVRELAKSSATVELAAEALGVIPARIAKSMAFRNGEACILLVTAGDTRIDNQKFKSAFGIKPKMMSPEETLAFTGHAPGGVCPFALASPLVKVYLDVSMQRFGTMFPACGSGNSAIELSCDELFACARAISWVDACKLPLA